MKNFAYTFLTFMLMLSTNVTAQLCYVDSNSTYVHLDSVRSIHDYNGERPADYAGVESFTSGGVYLSDEEALYHFSVSQPITQLTFDRSHLQFGSNGLPSVNFINIQIDNHPLIATPSDSLSYHLNLIGYTASVVVNPGGATDFQSITIDGQAFNTFAIGTGNGSSISNICVNAPLSIEDKTINFELFPNPSNGIVQINSQQNPSQIKIFNCIGKEVFLYSSAEKELNLSHLPSGVYFVQVTIRSTTSTQKLILN